MSRFPNARRQRRDARGLRQFAVLLIVASLSACGADNPPLGVVGHGEGDFGGVVSDEPTASLVARDVLSAGGTASDAAVALYFALSVTYPSAAGLGGGGVCLVHDNINHKVEALDFTTGRPARRPPDGRPEFAVPGNVRGMAALHARYGRLRWSQVVQPAERLARFGHPVSRAFARELRRRAGVVDASAELRALFAGAKGPILDEGEDLRQLELAAFIGRLRARGAGESYTGVLAHRLADSYRAAGGTVTIEDLRAYRPVWRNTLKGSFGNHDVHFAPPPVLGGGLAAGLWDTLKESGSYRQAPAGARDSTVVSATEVAYAALGGGGGGGGDDAIPDYSTTSFATMDHLGGAVACSVTMNAPFGVARLAPGTGVIAGAAPGPGRDGRISLAPMLIVNEPTGNAYFAAGASGDASAPTAMNSVALKLLLDQRKLTDAIGAARFHAGRADRGNRTVFAEAAADADARANAIWCAEGILRKPGKCVYVADKRGFGYAISAER